jgi:chromosome partitioning protein
MKAVRLRGRAGKPVSPRATMSVVVAVMSDKGGVGKTTAVQNIGAEVARGGQSVLLIDADRQADLTELCGLASEPNIGIDAILRQVPTPQADSYVRSVSRNLDLIGTHPQMRKADRELAQRTRREYALDEALSSLRSRYRLIVIDVGHSEVVQLNVMAIADAVVIPTTPAKLDADHIQNMLDEIAVMRRDLRMPPLLTPGRVVISISRRGSRAGIEEQGISLIRQQFTEFLSPAIVPFSPRMIEASAVHMSAHAYLEAHGQSRDRVLGLAVDAYAALAQQVLSVAPLPLGLLA